MTVELRAWLTTEAGINIPYYKLPMTRDALYAAIDRTYPNLNAQLYQYPNFNSGKLLVNYIDEMRWIARKVFQGWNARNTVAYAPAGSFRFQTTTGPGGSSQTHSPGVAEWQDRATWEGMASPGSTVPSWMGVAYSQVRPYPNELFGWSGAGIGILGSTYAVTSDNLLVRLNFSQNANSYGWQSWYVSRSDPSTSNFPTDISSMLSILIETSDDDGGAMARFNPRTATSTIGCYILNKDQLREWLNKLWETTIMDSIRTAFIGDGSNALLGVKWFYGIKDLIPTSAINARITLGNVVFTDVPMYPVAVKEFVEYDAGSVVVPQFYGDFRDWSATTYQMYLPFIGVIDLAPKDIVGKTLYLKYWINLTDGSAVCNLSTTPTTPDGTGTLFTTTCSWGYDIPIRVDSVMDALTRVTRVTASVVPGVGEVFGGPGTYSNGELAPNSNVMGDFQPKLVVFRQDDLSGAGFPDAEGAPGTTVTTVGACTGYLKASTVYNAGSLAMRRSGEIIAMLKEGVYL